MKDWITCKLLDLGMIVGGATPSTKQIQNYENGNISWITPKDLSSFKDRYIDRGERNITELGLKSCSTRLIPKNSILFSSRAPIGYIAIANKELCTNQGFKSIVPNEKIDYLFLYYLLKYNKSNIENIGSGTTFKEISATVMKNFEVKIPKSKNEQRKIASILDLIDNKIELNNKINNNLEQQAQALFKAWFVDFELFNKTKLSDWTYGTIQDLASEIVCGKTPSTKKKEYYGEDIPFITIPDMHNSVYTVKTERSLSLLGADSQPTKMLPKNSVCVSCIGTAGLVTLVSTPSQTNQQINSIIPKKNVSPYFVYLLMKTKSDEINKYGQSGSTIVNLNKTQFAKLECIIPSTESLNEFNDLLEPLFNKILINMKENIVLSDLRDTLLPKLMSGELDVSDIDF